MSKRGVFAVDRGIWDHPLLKSNAPFSRIQAWLWLISEAAWKPRPVYIAGSLIELQRGQVPHAIRFLAKTWGWEKTKVERFLDALKTATMIGTDTATGQTVITICNYDEYQIVGLPDATASGTDTATAARQQRDKDKEGKKERTKETDIWAVARATRPRMVEDFEKFWAAYPRRDGANPKAPALKVFTSAVRSGHDPVAIIGGAERYRKIASGKGQENTQYIAQAVTWLRQSRWADYPANVPIPGLMSDEERTRLWAEIHKGGPGERAN